MNAFTQNLLVPSSNRQIELSHLALRQEGVMSDFVSHFNNTIQGVFTGITNSLSGLINDSYDATNRTVSKSQATLADYEKKEHKLNFVLHADTLMPVPDGFKANWFEYVTAVEGNRELVIKPALAALEEFNTYLASFLGDKNSKISLQDKGREYKQLQKIREDQEKNFQSFFNSGSQQRAKLSDIFEVKAQIGQAAQVAIKNWKVTGQIGLRDIHERCNEIARKMERVIAMMQKTDDVAVSKQALLNLSEGGYEVARQIEHLALYVARAEIAMVVSGNQIDRLVSLIK